MEIRIRTSEGQQGNIQVLILPQGSNSCQNIEVPLKPLNLHQKVLKIDPEVKDQLILNTIKFKNKSLYIQDSLQWISNVLPDVPSIVDQNKDEIVFNYKSSFANSYIIITLSQPSDSNQSGQDYGEISIQTDNYSVLTIMKDQITQQANYSHKQIDITSEFIDDSVFHILDLLHPMVAEQYEIAKRNQLIDGLKELQINDEEEETFMSEEYREILNNASSIKEMYEQQPRKLSYLWGIIADLYVDTAKIKGFHNV